MNNGDNPPPALAYADHQTDAGRTFRSLDRAMTARLARVLGICLILFGIIITFLLCAGLSNSTNQNLAIFVPLIVLCVFVVPGAVLTVAGNGVDRDGRPSRIVVLVTSVLVFIMLSFGEAGSVWQLQRSRSAEEEQYVQIFAFTLLIVATAKLLYHTIRLIHISDFQGEGADAIRNFWDLSRFRQQFNERQQRRAVFATATFRAIIGIAVITAGIWCATNAFPPDARPGQGSTGLSPYKVRDLFEPSGLPLAERTAAIEGLDQGGWMTASDRKDVDTALRHYGAKLLDDIPRPVTSERVASALEDGDSRQVLSVGRYNHLRFSGNRLYFWGRNGAGYVEGNFCNFERVRYWSLSYVEATLFRIDARRKGSLTQAQADAVLGLYRSDHGESRLPVDPGSGARFLEDGTLNLYPVRAMDDVAGKGNARNPAKSDQVFISRTGEIIDQSAAKSQDDTLKLRALHTLLGESSAIIVLGLLIAAIGFTGMFRLHTQWNPAWPKTSMSRRLFIVLIAVVVIGLLCQIHGQANYFYASTGLSTGILSALIASGILILSELVLKQAKFFRNLAALFSADRDVPQASRRLLSRPVAPFPTCGGSIDAP
ncbi:MAG TPA: hypothetical protein VFE47_12035, partial [Tepidisphaeraceae bacterium]|nr:hypothetical protein [Tepidisphaeraceae bacterium]